MKQALFNNLKNIYGWKTKRKIVVISVDDYGNVRLDSKKARQNMDQAGLKVHTRFDAYDTLETREDLEALYEVLSSVKDKNGHHAVFTPFALPCNINFEAMAENGNQDYVYELLPETYRKLSAKDPKAYEGTWNLWQEGIKKGLMKPQLHGREHLNLKLFNEKLAKRDHEVLTALKNRSLTSISDSEYATISFTGAFQFWDFKENELLKEILEDGDKRFEEVYGYKSRHFNAPGGPESLEIHKTLSELGYIAADTSLIRDEPLGHGKSKKSINYTGKKNRENITYQVRNVVFEPTEDRGFEWVDYSLRQIETAFRWNKPAIISSHRVAFCGHIDAENRKIGLDAFRKLLKKIVEKWPDVEFMSSIDLALEITKEN